MLEIAALVFLSITNSKNAKQRGKSGGAAVGYTLGLWIGAEILGAVVGAMLGLDVGTYILALVFAIGGGVAAFFIARSGNIVAPAQPGFGGQQGAPYQQPGYPYQTQPQPPAYGQPAPQPPAYGQPASQGAPAPYQPAPQGAPAPYQAAPQVPRLCPACGEPAAEGNFCLKCGSPYTAG